MATPGYFASFSNGSGGQSARRLSSHNPKRSGSGPVAFSKQGSLTRPSHSQRLSRLNLSFGWDETVFRKSRLPLLIVEISSQKRSLPADHTIQVLRPLTSSGVRETPPSMSWK
ncbi:MULTISPECIES: hypothetical protein [Sorangium]|uniref:hypothetical protein n=1 Tax=Sorangium TaxID=39643 RepID=UPI003D9C5505